MPSSNTSQQDGPRRLVGLVQNLLVIEETGRLANVEVTPHILRHTFAKNLKDGGVRQEEIAALLGHRNISTTRRYNLPGERDLEWAVETLEG
ncbi:MAG: site-specific integrase [Nitrososphaera sp.]|nr:site-specific integrase [Nitrososphaera sp.]